MLGKQLIQAAAGAAGAGGAGLYVDDVFSTFLWEGDGGYNQSPAAATVTINNGIDLSGEGGLVWLKNRDDADNHHLYDTERGGTKRLASNTSSAESSSGANSNVTFNSTGLVVGSDSDGAGINRRGDAQVSWSFRKAPGWCDIVTWTGNGTAGRQIAHNLGSVPGMIIVKRTDASSSWNVFHRSLTGTHYLELETTGSAGAWDGPWNNTNPTSTHFTVGSSPTVNNNGGTYVAYIFAHDDASFGTDGDESIIKCGSYTGNGSSTGPVIDLGFEPQWLMVKRTNAARGWILGDIMRGAPVGSNGERLFANANGPESNDNEVFTPTSTGFTFQTNSAGVNGSGDTYIYMAIRRPHKPPTAATEVFAVATGNSSSTIPAFDSGFPVDFTFRRSNLTGNSSTRAHSRLQGTGEMYTPLTNAEGNNAANVFDSNSGFGTSFDSDDIAWMFKRAPGFMDVVTHTGTGSARTVNHDLGVVPEMMIVKTRTSTDGWATYHKTTGATQVIRLNTTSEATARANIWNNTAPTSSVFTVGSDNEVNNSGYNYIAYFFATLPGISKVGSYTGTGNAINVDCGFSSGARFILIKRTDASGDWYQYDTTRGIVSGNDPYLLLNDSQPQVTNTDYIDPLSSGFTVTSSAPTGLNASGGTYIFLAIA
jgi:hypothetical protein